MAVEATKLDSAGLRRHQRQPRSTRLTGRARIGSSPSLDFHGKELN
jgi:hypothetical protein